MWRYIDYSNELYHYGRKGMKWYQHIYGAVKDTYASIRTARNKHNEKVKQNLINYAPAKKVYKNRHKLNNKELQQAIDRVNKEQKIKELSKSPTRRFVDKGSISVAHSLEKGGKIAVEALGVGIGSYLIYRGVKKYVGKNTADVITSKGSTIAKAIDKDISERAKQRLKKVSPAVNVSSLYKKSKKNKKDMFKASKVIIKNRR